MVSYHLDMLLAGMQVDANDKAKSVETTVSNTNIRAFGVAERLQQP